MHDSSKSFRFFGFFVILAIPFSFLSAQATKPRPSRQKPPVFQSKDWDKIFFSDVASQLQGEDPTTSTAAATMEREATADVQKPTPDSPASTTGNSRWLQRISSGSLESLVKESKLRLDGIVTTPAKFAGGGFEDARREFTLLALLFAVIEEYPEEVRWQKSASLAKRKWARVAAGTKVGSPQAYNEAKLRLQDLAEMLNGNTLSDAGAADEFIWAEAVNRAELMKTLEATLRERMTPLAGDPKAVKEQPEEFSQLAELIETIGESLKLPGMPEADQENYLKWCEEMIANAESLQQAVSLGNADAVKAASAKIDQSCSNCHNDFN
jgi:cytochrome c556